VKEDANIGKVPQPGVVDRKKGGNDQQGARFKAALVCRPDFSKKSTLFYKGGGRANHQEYSISGGTRGYCGIQNYGLGPDLQGEL